MPAADVDVDVPLICLLPLEHRADLAGLSLELAAEGWDNVVLRWARNSRSAAARRAAATALLLQEQRIRPGVAGSLPVPMPAPVWLGVPGPLRP